MSKTYSLSSRRSRCLRLRSEQNQWMRRMSIPTRMQMAMNDAMPTKVKLTMNVVLSEPVGQLVANARKFAIMVDVADEEELRLRVAT